jgi:hypothetical protein
MITPRLARTLIVVVVLIAVTAAGVVFIEVDGRSQSVSDSLNGWLPIASLLAVGAAIVVAAVGRAARR